MIDMFLGSSLLAITDLLYFNLLVIVIVDAVTIKLISIIIKSGTMPFVLEDFLILIIRWSLIIAWVIILIVLNVIILANTYNDFQVTFTNYLIESGAIKE